MKARINAHSCIEELNNVKAAMLLRGLPMSRESVLESMRNIGLPMCSFLLPTLVKYKILDEIPGKGRKKYYKFSDKEPIYVGRLNSVITEIYKRKEAYKAKNETPETSVETQTTSKVESTSKVEVQNDEIVITIKLNNPIKGNKITININL